jgi:uncharacterized protein YdeI (YjbR/CyaY-like superfamily)
MDKKIVFFTEREQWRDWLNKNFEKEREVWFVFPTIASGEKGITYNDAVEEALCFGWIDGVAGTLDDKHQLRRFTPRRKGSTYSRLNIERLIFLSSQEMVHPKLQKEVEKVINVPFKFPKDIIDEIKKDGKTWENYQNFSDSYKRIRVAYIDAARNRPEEFKKRLNSFIKKTRDNKIISGYGGTEKYYK